MTMSVITESLSVFAITPITLALFFYFILYPIFFSPLSKVPSAHPLAPITSAWIQWQRFRNREFECVSGALERKGDYVRLGPNEIVVNTVLGMQSVYGIGPKNFPKHASYEGFMMFG